MKLFFCKYCWDVIKAQYKVQSCSCGKNYAYLSDNGFGKCETLHVTSEAMPFAIDNNHFVLAIACYEKDKRTSFIHAWTIDPTQKKNDCKIIMEEKNVGKA